MDFNGTEWGGLDLCSSGHGKIVCFFENGNVLQGAVKCGEFQISRGSISFSRNTQLFIVIQSSGHQRVVSPSTRNPKLTAVCISIWALYRFLHDGLQKLFFSGDKGSRNAQLTICHQYADNEPAKLYIHPPPSCFVVGYLQKYYVSTNTYV